MKTYVIGDLHGCYEEYLILLDKIADDAKGDEIQLVFVGDYLDKGPGIYELVASIWAGTKGLNPGYIERGITQVQCLWGNHEEKFSRYLQHEKEGSFGFNNPVRIQCGYNEKTKKLVELLLLDLTMYTYVEGRLIVHAGVTPLMTKLPSKLLSECSKDAKQILRVRYVNPEGKMVALGKETFTSDKFWAEVYDGRFGHIIYGHNAEKEIMHWPHATGIDTGCVYGWKLTALRLDPDGTNAAIQVDAFSQYRVHRSEGEE